MNTINQVPAGKFKSECLRIMDEVNKSGRPIVVTKRGVPLVRLVPIEHTKLSVKKFGISKGTIEICGDIVSGVNEEWDVEE